LAQVYTALGDEPADLDEPALLRGLFAAVRAAARHDWLLAYHDRSDGGLFVTLAEMAFASGLGLDVDLGAAAGAGPAAALFAEEPGAVLQVRDADLQSVVDLLRQHGLAGVSRAIGRPAPHGRLSIRAAQRSLLDESLVELRRAWSETSFRMRSLRDD